MDEFQNLYKRFFSSFVLPNQSKLLRGFVKRTLLYVGVDEIVAVMAGSMLWMDCSSLASVTDNLLMVSYRKNKDMFYSQINNPTLTAIGRIGFPTNNTIGRSLGGR